MQYNFEFRGNVNNSYGFETNLGIVYEVKFKPSSYLLGNNTAALDNNENK